MGLMSSRLLYVKRKPPPEKRVLPPRLALGHLSNNNTLEPASWAANAAVKPALPAPTTITSYSASVINSSRIVASSHGGCLSPRQVCSIEEQSGIRRLPSEDSF